MESEPAHSELPPSSADKWFHCHAWRRLNHGIKDVTSEAAEEGTRAHAVFEAVLTQGPTAEIPEEMFDHLMPCVEWVLDQSQDGTLHAENKVDFGDAFGFVDLTGTADVILDSVDLLTVADLKYGKGVVEVKDNFQLMCYLVGAVQRFGRREHYRLVILQPRAWHIDGPIRTHWLDNDDLDAFMAKLEPAIKGNFDPKSKATAGDHCRHFCKALGKCRTVAKFSLDRFRETPV